ncbi:MAG: hypothetical protein NW223_02160 [Hyphomicrobiaceae bacterium]|nr:hypothetical protein [Hyphomicrobiaceae bacterium]
MSIRLLAAAGFLGLTLGLTAMQPAHAETALDGSWSGGGTVTFPSGAVEKASCRATYRRTGSGYTMSGVCASPSGRAAQTAQLRKVGANSYSGRFYNEEFDISGSIHVTISGNAQSVRLSSPSSGAAANIHLRR